MDLDKILSAVPAELVARAASEKPVGGRLDLRRAAEIEITRDTYLEAESRGLTLTELLETEDYDPSEPGSPLDAFERQLAAHGIRVGGGSPVTVELFHRSAPSLMPEFILREIRRGQAMRPELQSLVAASSRVTGNRYTPFDVNATQDDPRWAMRPVGDGANVPAILVTERVHSVDVPDYGLALKASYKALRHRTTTQFKVLLWYIGYRMQVDKFAMLVDVLVNGDGNDNPATVITTGTSGTLTYEDIVNFWAEMHPFEMNTLLCGKTLLLEILTLEEFKDPMAGFRFQSTGDMITPLGSNLLRSDDVDDDLILGIDRRFAAEEVITQPLTVEYDKIIEQRFEEAVITESVAYAKLLPGAVIVLDTEFS